MDLQADFLASEGASMPVDAVGAESVIQTANAVLARQILPLSIPIIIVNQFPHSDRIGNFFRHHAAIIDTPGAALDGRIVGAAGVTLFAKSKPSAFTNPGLETFLKANHVTELYVMGVFAEGCVRSTVLEARKRGYGVVVPTDAVATNASWKKRFALWAMRRAGATIVPTLL
jgi:nicotinamidase-related amidase